MHKGGLLGAVAALALALVGAPAAAENRAVVVVQDNYQKFGRVAAPDVSGLLAKMKASGLRVANGFNLGSRDLRIALQDLARPDPQPGARIVVLTGQFVGSESDSWLLASEAGAPSLATADLSGMAVSVVVDLMRDGGGRGVLFLADAPGSVTPGIRLKDGIGGTGTAGPVNVVTGSAQGVAAAAEALLTPGTTLGQALARDASLRLVQGTGAAAVPFPAGSDPLGSGGRVLEGEAEAWVQAAARNSVEAYEAFLHVFPGGRYADVARARLSAMRGQDAYASPLAEVQLNLSRAERAQIQRQLTLLGHDTKGIDGIFGADTRTALTRWQRDAGLAATGYLDAEAVRRLKRQAQERADALEAEAKARQSPSGRRDEALWQDVAKPGGLPGMRAYLERFPNGLHAAEARRALGQADGSAEQKQVWDRAVRADTIAAYQQVIDKYPDAEIAREAGRRIAALKAARVERQAEEKLGLDPVTRKIVESRLSAAGFDAGPVDGTFDARTRAAIRAYQQSRKLRATGYMDEGTALRLLADSLVGR